MINLSAFRWVSPFARGLVRDLRARWALEEAASRYGERLIGPDDPLMPAAALMTTVLRIPRHTSLVAEYPSLEAHRLRCEARPAFQKALAAQLKPFKENAPVAA